MESSGAQKKVLMRKFVGKNQPFFFYYLQLYKMTEMYPATDVKPSDCFQKLCQVMISEGLSRQRIEDFRVILHMIMLECSRANIEVYNFLFKNNSCFIQSRFLS